MANIQYPIYSHSMVYHSCQDLQIGDVSRSVIHTSQTLHSPIHWDTNRVIRYDVAFHHLAKVSKHSNLAIKPGAAEGAARAPNREIPSSPPPPLVHLSQSKTQQSVTHEQRRIT
jgi:hypothetical protein